MHDRARSARFSRSIRRTFSPGFFSAGFLITALALLSPLANGQDAPPPKQAAKPKIWKIAFDRAVLQGYYVGEAVHSDIFVMYSDRRGLRRVTNDGRSHGPVWSPDGSKLLFLHHKKEDSAVFLYPVRRPGVDTDIGILDSDRGEPLEESLGPGFIPQVAWSPDGKKLAYVASREKKNHPAIYISLADGSGEHRLTDPELKADDPAWSPDGRKFAIAVEHGIHGTPQGLYVMNDDGSDLKNLSGKKDHIQSPVWSPDGKRIAFLVGKDSDTQIFMVNADGSGLRQLTNERKSYCRHPSWSPDSKEIVFECGEHFNRYYYYNPLWSPLPKTDIYLLTVDEPDAKLTRLSQDGGSNPVFCPASFSRDEAAERQARPRD